MNSLTKLEPDVLTGPKATTIEKIIKARIHTVEYLATMTPASLAMRAGMGKDTAEGAIRKALDYTGRGYIDAKQLHDELLCRTRLTTGSFVLDELLGGGVESETTLEIIGPNGSGKTQICHKLAVTAQLPIEEGGLDGEVAWIDTEDTFRPDRIAQITESLGLDTDEFLSKIVRWKAKTSLDQVRAVEELSGLCHQRNIKLVIVDSMMAHLRGEYLGRGTLAERQQLLQDALKKLSNISQVYALTSVYTNQVVSTPDLYKPVKAAGGHIMGHAATTRLFLRKTTPRGKTTYFAKLTKSPYLPDGEAPFVVDEYGIRDTPGNRRNLE